MNADIPIIIPIMNAASVRPADINRLATTTDGLQELREWTADEMLNLSPWALASYVKAVGKDYAVEFLDYLHGEELRGKASDTEKRIFWPLNDAIFGHRATGIIASMDCSTAELIQWAADRTLTAWQHHIGDDLDLADSLAAAYSDLAERIGDPKGQLKNAQREIEQIALLISRNQADPIEEAVDMPGKSDTPASEGDYYAGDVQIINGCDVRPEPIGWIWPGFLATGKVEILAGPAGVSKTTLALALAAILTRAGTWPDGSRAPVGDVLIWSGEDDPADTLVPRLLAAGADMNRIGFISTTTEADGERRPFDPATDTQHLRRALSGRNVKLLIVDPIVSAVAGDSHKNGEVRRALQPLVDLAASIGCCVLGITHFSKGTQGSDPVERVTGSIAFGALARIVFACAKSSDDEASDGCDRLFVRSKSNIGPDGGGWRYALEQVAVPGHVGLFASRIRWGETLEGGARELLSRAEAQADPEEQSATADAKEFLSGLLADGPVGAKQIKGDADQAGFAWRTVQLAAQKMNIERIKGGFKSGWTWKLPPKAQGNAEDAMKTEQEIFASSGNSCAFADDSELEL
jgi:putative DNA primase/helicase